MKRILVMCKDREQWEAEQERIENTIGDSLTTTVDIRQDSIIVQGSIYSFIMFLMTPDRKDYKFAWTMFDSIKWLCDESEFDKEIVDYLKGRVYDKS